MKTTRLPISQPELIVVAKPSASLRALDGRVTAANTGRAASLNYLLGARSARIQPLFGPSEEHVRATMNEAAAGAGTPPSTFYIVEAAPDNLPELLVDFLNEGAIEGAYIKPAGEPPVWYDEIIGAAPEAALDLGGATPDFSGHQGYLEAAPRGVGARYAWAKPGGKGAGVRVIDLEWGWNFSHEDLLQNAGGIVGGTGDADTDHGTAVLGEISGDHNGRGILGIAPDAIVSAVAFSMPTARAIRLAADRLSPGDILLLEIHLPGPRYGFQGRQDQAGYIAVEWWPDVFTAIRWATERGILVVEAAGNGSENLDDPLYSARPTGFPASWKNPFNRANPQCGAIVVGAGAPPPGTHGRQHGQARSRLDFSNYGALIDAQGWGREVTTCGRSWGTADLHNGGPNAWYTDQFAGTSSASPIVTGVLACAQGVAKAAGKALLTPSAARALLRATGSAQQDEVGRPSQQRIGHLPDLRSLLREAGLDGPTAPPTPVDATRPSEGPLAASTTLREFLSTAGGLSLNERKLIVEQALVLLEQNYVHLPLKAAMHAVNPIQRLRLLRARLERQTAASMSREWSFHAEMSAIFHSVRDLHTNYLLPLPFAGKIAYLPFLVEEFFEGTEARFIVSHVAQGFTAPGFGPGAQITHWSGIPIQRAVELNADRFAGSNAAARRSRGVESLTLRSLRLHVPPDEEWVTISYRGTDGAPHELRESWRVTDNLPKAMDPDAETSGATTLGVDLGVEEIGRAKRLLFAPHSVAQEQALKAGAVPVVASDGDVPTTMEGVFRARRVTTSAGTFGHIRIFTFSVDDPEAFVAEFVRLIEQLPEGGLIVDVRGNGGGHIYASEFTLQTLTPRRITPEPAQFIVSPLNLALCRRYQDGDLRPWFPSMEQAVETGAAFSGAFPITPEDGANSIGQRYWGPVLLITDARCYSATDIFAAGFQDHGIGPVLGVDDHTGAGGANVWTHELLRKYFAPITDSPYRSLPKGAGLRVAIRRTLRVGPLGGTPVEDLGVTPDQRHRMTRRDVLHGNVDLLETAGQLLAAARSHRLALTPTRADNGSLTIEIRGSNIQRVDVFVDGRPRASVDLAGAEPRTLTGIAGGTKVRVDGYFDDALVATRTAHL